MCSYNAPGGIEFICDPIGSEGLVRRGRVGRVAVLDHDVAMCARAVYLA